MDEDAVTISVFREGALIDRFETTRENHLIHFENGVLIVKLPNQTVSYSPSGWTKVDAVAWEEQNDDQQ